MENKINIAKLLKDCPKGMELDCTMFEGLEFDSIVDDSPLPIRCRILNPDSHGYNIYNFTKYGCWNTLEFAKCIIFPKGKTSWDDFQRPFKDGDVVTSKIKDSLVTFIYKERMSNIFVKSHFVLYNDMGFCKNVSLELKEEELRSATEEEKEKIFKSIKEHGYRWNTENKSLEKLIELKFKVGDVVQHDDYKVRITEVNIDNNLYRYETLLDIGVGCIPFSKQDRWELVQNRLDITTLKPFESRVLVRSDSTCDWNPAIFGFFNGNYFYVLGDCSYKQCIPYEGNEHLLGTKNDCDEYYKNCNI